MSAPVDRLLARLDGVRRTGEGRWLARCPAHDDGRASLSIRDAGDKVLIHCFAGCEAETVLGTVGLEFRDLHDDGRSFVPSARTASPVSLRDAAEVLATEAGIALLILRDLAAGRTCYDHAEELSLCVGRIAAIETMLSDRRAA